MTEKRDPLRDGVTFIKHVKTDVFPPAVAEVTDDAFLHYAVFDPKVAAALEIARRDNSPCYLDVRTGLKSRYIKAVKVVPTDGRLLTECYHCGNYAVRHQLKSDGSTVYECGACHRVMRTTAAPKVRA